MNPIQKESDLSKSEMLYSFKQIRLKRFGHFLAKKTNLYPTYYTFLLDERCPCIAFFKRAQGDDGVISAPRLHSMSIKCSSPLLCIYHTT